MSVGCCLPLASACHKLVWELLTFLKYAQINFIQDDMHHDKLSETRSKAGRELVYCSLDRYNVGKHKLVTDSTSVVGLNVCAAPLRSPSLSSSSSVMAEAGTESTPTSRSA